MERDPKGTKRFHVAGARIEGSPDDYHLHG